MLVALLKNQMITLKLQKLKINLMIIIMTNILQFQSLILQLVMFLLRDQKVNLVTKTDFDAKLSSLNRKITKNKINQLLVQNDFKKLKTFDSSYFIGKSHFEEDVVQNYLIFQPLSKYLLVIYLFIISI